MNYEAAHQAQQDQPALPAWALPPEWHTIFESIEQTGLLGGALEEEEEETLQNEVLIMVKNILLKNSQSLRSMTSRVWTTCRPRTTRSAPGSVKKGRGKKLRDGGDEGARRPVVPRSPHNLDVKAMETDDGYEQSSPPLHDQDGLSRRARPRSWSKREEER